MTFCQNLILEDPSFLPTAPGAGLKSHLHLRMDSTEHLMQDSQQNLVEEKWGAEAVL